MGLQIQQGARIELQTSAHLPAESTLTTETQVDYTSEVPGCGGLFPAGLVELSRRRDILGNVTVENQYNFAIYCLLEKAPGDDTGAAENAAWVMGLQEWVQRQSVLGLAPRFGSGTAPEVIRAENGTLYEVDGEEILPDTWYDINGGRVGK